MLSCPPSSALWRVEPPSYHGFINPKRQTTPLFQSCIILPPIANTVGWFGFRFPCANYGEEMLGLYTFIPYLILFMQQCPQKVQRLEPYSKSPFEDLNGFRYHDNWLRNFLMASSLNGRGTGKPVKHKLK